MTKPPTWLFFAYLLLGVLLVGGIFGRSVGLSLLASAGLLGLLVGTNAWGLRRRVPLLNSGRRAPVMLGWGIFGLGVLGILAGTVATAPAARTPAGPPVNTTVVAIETRAAALEAARTATAVAEAGPAPEQRAAAAEHYAAAVGWYEEGNLGLALEEVAQALGAWPAHEDAQALRAEIAPQATAAAQIASAPSPPRPAPAAPAPAAPREPAPIQLTGRGQQVTQGFTLQPGLVIVSLAHNGNRNFIAALLNNSDGQRVEGLVNEIGPFDGSKAFGLRTGGEYVINVQADGGWAIQLRQPAAVAESNARSFTGTGAKATPLFSLNSGLRRFILKHEGNRNFIVALLNSQGGRVDGLVNVIGPFDGSKGVQIRQAGVYILTVQADGPWSISVE